MIHPLTENKNCTRCSLRSGCKQVVWGDGPNPPSDTDWMLIAEAPGKWEDIKGKPLVGKTGEESDWLLARHGISRSKIYVTNVVKCRPKDNRDPKQEEIDACSFWLEQEINLVEPKIIITMGRFSTQWFLGNVKMEQVHGIPFQMESGIIVIPIYHVAAGLHQPTTMLMIQSDFQAIRDVISGKRPPRHIEDPFAGKEFYHRITVPDDHLFHALRGSRIAIDTEWGETCPLCLTFSTEAGVSFLIDYDNDYCLPIINDVVNNLGITTILHNSIYDLPNLEMMGIHPAKIADTMIMAYLLQSEPQGLKPLAYRHHGMEMQSYEEVIGDSTRLKALKYLAQAVEWSWPDSKPVVEYPKGKRHVRQPQNIGKKIEKILHDATLKEANPYERWHKIPEEEGRDIVEVAFGKMHMGNLSEIDYDKYVHYACRDADTTLRIYDTLWPRIVNDGLEQAFEIDMNTVPIAVDMMKSGIKANVPYLQNLSAYFQEKMDSIEAQVERLTGQKVNPGSHDQVSELLFKHLKLRPLKKTKGGQDSTSDQVLSQLSDQHPSIQFIRDYREMSKLKGTYSDQIPSFVADDGRVHTTIRLTRTATGRLSMANPGLQQIPIKTEEGRKIRSGFIAEAGHSFVSCDLNQIELRILADHSNDPIMLDVYRTGGDIHMRTACELFGKPPDQIDKHSERKPSKNANFLIVYGGGGSKLRETLLKENIDWPTDRCDEFIRNWRAIYKDVDRYMNEVHQFARRNGYVVDMFGRRRYVPTIKAKNKWLQLEALRQAGNMPIQASAAEIMKKAMADIWFYIKEWRKQGINVRPVLQIHDDLVSEVPDDFVDTYAPLIKFVMENAVILKVPVIAEPEVGKQWYPMKEWVKGEM